MEIADQVEQTLSNRERIDAELARIGGARMLSDLSVEKIELWERQALVLSFFRSCADLYEATKVAGVPVAEMEEWRAGNIMDFADRQESVQRELAWSMHQSVYQMVLDGRQKSPTVIKLLFDQLMPDGMGRGRGGIATDSVLAKLQEEIKRDAEFDQRVETAVEERLANERAREAAKIDASVGTGTLLEKLKADPDLDLPENVTKFPASG